MFYPDIFQIIKTSRSDENYSTPRVLTYCKKPHICKYNTHELLKNLTTHGLSKESNIWKVSFDSASNFR